jgi:hypothetical protein
VAGTSAPDNGDVQVAAQTSAVSTIEGSFGTKKQDRSRMKCRELWERGKTLTLNSGSVYYVRNNTYIHLRAKSLNIYMYRRERIYKEPLKYNNKND